MAKSHAESAVFVPYHYPIWS